MAIQTKIEIPVLINHINYGGHVGYDSMLTILQEARIRWLQNLVPSATELNIADEIGWVVREAHALYQKEAFHQDVLVVRIEASTPSKIEIKLNYTVTRKGDDAVICTGSTKHIFLGTNNRKISKAPNTLRNALTKEG